MVLQNPLFYTAGVGFLFLSKMKNIFRGYSSPKPFGFSQMQKCIDYDVSVVDDWLCHFESYTESSGSLEGKNILELGPGSDLGTGLYLLAKGCSKYNACDVNDLIKTTPDEFYVGLFEKLKKLNSDVDLRFLKEQLEASKSGRSSKLNYQVRDDFDLVSAFGEEEIDLVFSQAAFEHFDDIEATISQLSAVCKSGATSVIQVDLKAHSRWIRDEDPNNIYRYPQWLYKLFSFRGIPNRVRPYQYKNLFEEFGWKNVIVTPLKVVKDPDSAYLGMNKSYIDKKNQMEYLSIIICATKK